MGRRPGRGRSGSKATSGRGTFGGVATVCLKLFLIVGPRLAFFGQKDAQQVAVVSQMVQDLKVDLQIRVVPTVRDADGLALSSRNARLSPDERQRALAIPRALDAGLAAARGGGDPVAAARPVLAGLDVDYVDVATLRRPSDAGDRRARRADAPHRQHQARRSESAGTGAGRSRADIDGQRTRRQRITPFHFGRAKERRDLIAMVTAYDAPSARLAEKAAIDGILVGDSAAMTVLGHDSTVQITVDEMLMLTRAVARSVYKPLVVADMPFGSFQVSDEEAVRHAVRLVKEGGAGAVKLEGAGPTLTRVKAIVGVGIPVMGHVGLTPQSAVALGGYPRPGAARSRREAPARRSAGAAERRLLRRRPRSDARRSSPSASRSRSRFQPSGSAPARTATARFSSGTTCWA